MPEYPPLTNGWTLGQPYETHGYTVGVGHHTNVRYPLTCPHGREYSSETAAYPRGFTGDRHARVWHDHATARGWLAGCAAGHPSPSQL